MAVAKTKSGEKGTMAKTTRQRKAKREGPKKALSTYLIFSMARREDILKERPELRSNVTEISKIIEKLPYQLKHEKDRERYLKEKEEFERKGAVDENAVRNTEPVAKRQKTQQRRQVSESEDDEENDDEDDDGHHSPVQTKSGPSAAAPGKPGRKLADDRRTTSSQHSKTGGAPESSEDDDAGDSEEGEEDDNVKDSGDESSKDEADD